MRLVDDQRVVAAQQSIVLQLAQQDAVGHQLHAAVRPGAIGEAHLIADGRRRRSCRARPRGGSRSRARRYAAAACARSARACRARLRCRSSAAASSCRTGGAAHDDQLMLGSAFAISSRCAVIGSAGSYSSLQRQSLASRSTRGDRSLDRLGSAPATRLLRSAASGVLRANSRSSSRASRGRSANA